MYNQYQQQKIPKLTKALAEQCIAMQLRVTPAQCNFVKLTESPREWKHSCVPTGVTILVPRKIQYSTSVIEYSVCTSCRKVMYFYEEVYASY
jgi:hypothetical protein